MSKGPFPGDLPGDTDWEEGQPQGGGALPPENRSPHGGEFSPLEGFQPTDLSRLFGEGGLGDLSTFDVPGRRSSEERTADWDAERDAERENVTPKKLFEKEVKVMAVYEQTAITGQRAYFVQLKDRSNREIKVYIGYQEATSISIAAEGMGFKRPLTHDLTKTIIERLGWKIDRVIIDDLYNETFYAKLVLTLGNETIDIDCRPSDSIALALRARAPIYVAEDVLKTAAHEDNVTEEGDSSD